MKLLKIRNDMQKAYAKHSRVVDKGIKFLLALFTFLMINKTIGTMEQLSSPAVLLGMSLLCAFFSPIITVIISMGLIIAHMASASLGCAGVMMLLFLVMFCLYCRFTPERAIIILLVPIAFMLRIPYIIPIICGLLLTPVTAVPIAFGTIIHYGMVSFSAISKKIAESDDLMSHISIFVKELIQNKEIWIMAIAFTAGVSVVYLIRRLEISYSREIAIIAGVVVHIIVIVLIGNLFEVSVSMMPVVAGNAVAVIIGYLINSLFLAADYKRVEMLQYEDDDYYYYVKAVPKVKLMLPEEKPSEEQEEIQEEINNEVENEEKID